MAEIQDRRQNWQQFIVLSILAAMLDFGHIGFSEMILNVIFEFVIVDNLYKDTKLGIINLILWCKGAKSIFRSILAAILKNDTLPT